MTTMPAARRGPAAGVRQWVGGLLPGARARRRQIEQYALDWGRANERAEAARPVWVVLGDSTAQAVGASSIDSGYVAIVRTWLSARDGIEWHVLNLSRAGARVTDLLDEQVPRLGALQPPDLVSCAVGANDLLRRTPELGRRFEELATALPAGALLGNLPQGLRPRYAEEVNRGISELVEERQLRLVDLWSVTGPPWRGRFAADQFHPNDTGYRSWASAFVAALQRTT